MLRTRALSSRLRNCFKMFGCVWFWGRELMSCLHKSQEMGTTYYSYPRLFELKTEAHRKKANMATAQWGITQCQWLAVFFPSNFSFFPPARFLLFSSPQSLPRNAAHSSLFAHAEPSLRIHRLTFPKPILISQAIVMELFSWKPQRKSRGHD